MEVLLHTHGPHWPFGPQVCVPLTQVCVVPGAHTHFPPEQFNPAAQVFPHEPQLLMEVLVFTQ